MGVWDIFPNLLGRPFLLAPVSQYHSRGKLQPPTLPTRLSFIVKSEGPPLEHLTMPPTIPQRGGPSGLKVRPGQVSGKTLYGQGAKRHRKILKDNIRAITRPDIRRLARRGGVKRISATVYNEVRAALKDRLRMILRDCVTYVDYRRAKTVTVYDVIHSLKRIGRPVYGFDPETYKPVKTKERKRNAQADDSD
ncbi:hypothetical protein N8I77_000690 [Diaporthe amygdali]|uniref:Histone H4 n=1 Tax=Phomopsis amygdali TaxID=1214568 RepID=A0AAD9SMM3_PHOAM|nr:hypothetical protein N8I77_000690 [Diaporthe amygdali]